MINNWFAKIVQVRLDEVLFTSKKVKVDTFRNLNFNSFEVFNSDENYDKNFLWLYFSSSDILDKNIPDFFIKIFILEKSHTGLRVDLIDKKYDLVINDSNDNFSPHSYLFQRVKEKVDQISKKNQKSAIQNLKTLISLATDFTRLLDAPKILNSFIEYNQLLVSLERDFLSYGDFSKINKFIRSFLKNLKLSFDIELIDDLELSNRGARGVYFPYPKVDDVNYYIHLDVRNLQENDVLAIYFLYHAILNIFILNFKNQASFDEEGVWKEILELIPYPLVLIDESGEVRQHNSLFLKTQFAPIDCLSLRSKEKIRLRDDSYNIFKTEISHFDEKRYLIIFFTEIFYANRELDHISNSRDLGIITSSIAHELNNPIAGILSGLSYLILNSHGDDELKEILNEMKNGATRCKLLVNTFLGFSKANLFLDATQSNPKGELEFCLSQAQSLLRFRSIESGIRLNFRFTRSESITKSINSSMLTMTFYLIFGELMTLLSHQNLVTQAEVEDKVLSAEIMESKSFIQFEFQNLNVNKLEISNLVQNLLKIEGLEISLENKILRLNVLHL